MADKKSRELTRRRFLEGSVGVFAGGAVACGSDSSSGGEDGGEAGTGGSASATGGAAGNPGSGGGGSGDSPSVGLVRSTDWTQAVLDAIALVGGLPDLTGMTVLLKPNCISTDPCPTTTRPEVIAGAIRAVRARGATTVLVAEDGFTGPTLTSMEANGILQVCTEEGAEAVELKDTQTTPVSVAAATGWGGTVNLYTRVYDADYIINMPVCKTHSLAAYTMALKNYYGCIRSGDRAHGNNLGERLAEMHLAKQENFVILDASAAMVTGGPTGGQTAQSRVVVASRDAIAVDVTGLCIQKEYGPRSGVVFNLGVWDQPQVSRAMELAFPGWITSPQDFSYAHQGVDDIEAIMAWRNA